MPRSFQQVHALVVSRNPPWPARAGGRMRDWQNILALSRFARVSVLFLQGGSSPPPSEVLTEIEEWSSLDSLLMENPPPFESMEKPLNPDWRKNQLGHPSDHLWNPYRHEILRQRASACAYSFALIEDQMLWRYADAVRPSCPVIVDCHNIQSRLDYEHAKGVPWYFLKERRARFLASRRMAAIEKKLASDRFFVCSETDFLHLSAAGVPPTSIAVVGNTVTRNVDSMPTVVSPLIANCRDPIIVFPGVLNYPPNVRAAMQLINVILPRVQRQVPRCKLLLVGLSPTFEILNAAHGRSDVFVTGEVVDTAPYFRAASVMSVPLREGGGTRFKILEAFKFGLPVVSTRKGCEGLDVTDGLHLIIADGLEEHIDAIARLIRSASDRKKLNEASNLLVERSYSLDTAATQVRAAIDLFWKQWHPEP